MTAGETRFVLPARLGWELRALARHSAVVLPVEGEPVLNVRRPDGSRLAVPAVQYRGHWLFVWAGGGQVWAGRPDVAARRIASVAGPRRAA